MRKFLWEITSLGQGSCLCSIRPVRSVVIMLTFGSEHNFEPTAPLAQLAEQLTLNQWVPGSSPGGRTKIPVSSHENWDFSFVPDLLARATIYQLD